MDWQDQAAHLAALSWWAPRINQYIDETYIKDNLEAQAVLRVCTRLYNRFTDFSKILDPRFKLIKQTQRRLNGLANA